MHSILAFGGPAFVRMLQFGGVDARLADGDTLETDLAAAIGDPKNGVVIVDAALGDRIPAHLLKPGRNAAGARLLVLGSNAGTALRERIRQVAGADLMASKPTGHES